MPSVSDSAGIISIVSGIVVVVGSIYAFSQYWGVRYLRRRRLTQHLRRELLAGTDRGQRTVVQLMRVLSMTEQQVLDAGFGSRRVRPLVTLDPATGHARAILFQYARKDAPPES